MANHPEALSLPEVSRLWRQETPATNKGTRNPPKPYTNSQLKLLTKLCNETGEISESAVPAWLVDRVVDAMGKQRVDQLTAWECEECWTRMSGHRPRLPGNVKQCRTCGDIKSRKADFYVERATKDGFQSECKDCAKKRSRERYVKVGQFQRDSS